MHTERRSQSTAFESMYNRRSYFFTAHLCHAVCCVPAASELADVRRHPGAGAASDSEDDSRPTSVDGAAEGGFADAVRAGADASEDVRT